MELAPSNTDSFSGQPPRTTTVSTPGFWRRHCSNNSVPALNSCCRGPWLGLPATSTIFAGGAPKAQPAASKRTHAREIIPAIVTAQARSGGGCLAPASPPVEAGLVGRVLAQRALDRFQSDGRHQAIALPVRMQPIVGKLRRQKAVLVRHGGVVIHIAEAALGAELPQPLVQGGDGRRRPLRAARILRVAVLVVVADGQQRRQEDLDVVSVRQVRDHGQVILDGLDRYPACNVV